MTDSIDFSTSQPSPNDSEVRAELDAKVSKTETEKKDLRNASKEERTIAVQTERVILHPQLKKAVNRVLWMIKQQPRSRAPGLIVTGPTNSGKTTLGNAILKAYSQLAPSSFIGSVRPCAVMIELSGLATSRAVYGRILEQINAPVNNNARVADRELVVTMTLRNINCRLLILDETQDVLKTSERDQQRVLDAIKYLMNSLKMPVLALGVEQAGKAFDSDQHLRARFSEIKLPPWRDDDDLVDLLASLEPNLLLQGNVNLRTREMITKLLELSDGKLGYIIDIVKNAAIEAIISGKETITPEMLRLPWDVPSHEMLDGPTIH
ncbi:TniB family NTP-binding protein [Dyella sp. S184]|uniref:TniB family NTP-binding protein n=1 Tax=Dyella sp. S184 TaxID=1641862 RepID=UPI00131B5AA3|nr:TniB family NTP-binding protein [Dyella sp. S184]